MLKKLLVGLIFAVLATTSSYSQSVSPSGGGGTVTSVVCSGVTITGTGTCPPAYGFSNCSLAASVSSNIMTVALKDNAGSDPSASSPCELYFRNATAATGSWTQVTVSAALSITTNATGATLGSTNNSAFRFWVVAFNNSGTAVLALYNATTLNANNNLITPINEGLVQSSTAISGSATAAATFYTPNGTTVSSKAILTLGYVEYNSTGLSTAGTYASGPNFIQTLGPGIKRAGDVLQRRNFNTTSTTVCGSSIGDSAVKDTIALTSAANLVEAAWSITGIQTTSTAAELHLFRGTSGGTGVGLDAFTATSSLGTVENWATGDSGIMDFPNSTSQLYTLGCKNGTWPGGSPSNGRLVLKEIMG